MRFIFLLLITFQYTFSQSQHFTYFNKVFTADTMNILSMVCKPLPTGDYFVLGGYVSINQQHTLYLRKINSQGENMWFKSLASGNNIGVIANGRETILSKDNHLMIAFNQADTLNTNDKAVHLLKLDIDGNLIWKQVYQNGLINSINQIVETEDNGFAFTGIVRPSLQEIGVCYVRKIDSMGNIEWEQTYQLEGHTVGQSIEQTHDKGFIISGTGEMQETKSDIFVIKADSLGNEEWRRTFGGEENERYAYIKLLTPKNQYEQTGKMEYLLLGEDEPEQYSDDLYIAQLDNRGIVLWENRYDDFAGLNYPYPVFETMPILKNGGFKIVANYRSFNDTRVPILMDFNRYGQVNWQKVMSIDTSANVYIKDLQETPDGGYIMAGFKFSPAPQQSWIVKVDADGNTCWPPNCDSTVLITNIEEPSIPSNAVSLSLLPNPASERVEVVYQIPKEGVLRVYDYQGRLIKNEKLTMNNLSLTLEVNDWSSGVYLYQLEIGGERLESGKLVVEN